MQDILTTHGDAYFIRSFEDVMTRMGNLNIRPRTKIEIQQVSETIELGTQDGISYNYKPVEYYGEF